MASKELMRLTSRAQVLRLRLCVTSFTSHAYPAVTAPPSLSPEIRPVLQSHPARDHSTAASLVPIISRQMSSFSLNPHLLGHYSSARSLRHSSSLSLSWGGIAGNDRSSTTANRLSEITPDRRNHGDRRFHSCGWGLSCVAMASAAAAVAATVVPTVRAKEIPLKPIPQDVLLYQYEACPFCNKVKAFLDYYGISYKVVEVNPLTRKEIKWSEYKKVPILVVDGEPLNDSSAIITTLQDRLNPEEGKISRKPEQKEEEAKWRSWVDDHLVHLLSPNIYRTPSEALEAFDYITTNGNFGTFERAMARYVGASTMYFIGKKLKKKHKIEDARESLYSALKDWTAALGSRKFLGGDKPNLADLAVFGVLRPIRNMQTGKDMMENTDIGKWYSSMEAEVGTSARVEATN